MRDLNFPYLTNFLYLLCRTPVKQFSITDYLKKCVPTARDLALCFNGLLFSESVLLIVDWHHKRQFISSLVRHFPENVCLWGVHWQRPISLLEINSVDFASFGPVNSKPFMTYYLNHSSSKVSGRPKSSIKVQRYTAVLKRKREIERKIWFVARSMLSVRLDLNPEISGTFPRLCGSTWLLLEKKNVCVTSTKPWMTIMMHQYLDDIILCLFLDCVV